MDSQVRVRFAPSPTGGLHLGGVRTILYNYLFAKKNKGQFILRIEDTDQKRFVEGAEEYIMQCLNWLDIKVDEGVGFGGEWGPYKQSERKEIYQLYAQELVEKGFAYYAFDSPEELETKRQQEGSFQYDHATRMQMKNSLTLSAEETKKLIHQDEPYVIRIKTPAQEKIHFKDLLRGEIIFDTSLIDDKVLMKADGLPTYHLAVVVDDYLMKISHVFRGEEWLPSAPIHYLLWHYLGWQNAMPEWIHLPLILKPDGNGKLSKRDGERLGIPIYALEWKDHQSNELVQGFKEKGFLPQALINFLVTTSWNNGDEQEIFSLDELVQFFSIERLQHHGAKFNYEKAKWFNHQYIQKTNNEELLKFIKDILSEKNILHAYSNNQLIEIIALTKERCFLLNDFYDLNQYFFHTPSTIDTSIMMGKWKIESQQLFDKLTSFLKNIEAFTSENLSNQLHIFSTQENIKLSEIQLPLRVMLVGGKFGVGVMQMMSILGKEEVLKRIQNGTKQLNTTLK